MKAVKKIILLYVILAALSGCAFHNTKQIIEDKTEKIIDAVVMYSFHHPENQAEFDEKWNYYSSKNLSNEEMTELTYNDYFSECEKEFSKYVLSECYSKMKGGILMDPLFAIGDYELQIGEIKEYENSISAQCDVIFDMHTVRCRISFIKQDNDYYATGIKYSVLKQ